MRPRVPARARGAARGPTAAPLPLRAGAPPRAEADSRPAAALAVHRGQREAAPFVAFALLVLALAGCGPRDVQSPAALVGHWEGTVAWRDASTPLALDVAQEGDSLVATLSAPALGVARADLGRFAYASPRVHFVARDSAGAFAFDGWLRRGLVVGAIGSPAFGAERNRSRLPQFSFKRASTARRRLPFAPAAGVDSVPPPTPEPQRSLGAWLLAR